MTETIYFKGKTYTPEAFEAYIKEHPEVLEPPAPPELTFDDLKAAKLLELAAARYEAETGGVEIPVEDRKVIVKTDRESQAMITGAALKAMQDQEYSCRWKTVQGFITVSATQIVAVADAVRDHVQAQFDREALLVAQVDKAKIKKDLEAITWESSTPV